MRVTWSGLTAALLLGSCTLPSFDVWHREPSLLERYDLVAFRDDRGQVIERAIKWRDEVPYTLEGMQGYRGFAVRHLERLANLTGLSIHEAGEAAGRDRLRIVIGPAAMGEALWYRVRSEIGIGGGFDCFGVIEPEAPPTVFIRDDLPEEQIRACIVQETTQMLGLPGDLDGRDDTAFTSNWRDGGQHLSDDDQKLLKVHYHPWIVPGMPREEALRQATRVIESYGWSD